MIKQTVLLAALVALAPDALLAATPTTTSAATQPAGPGPRGDWFAKLDTNHDGVVTKEEMQAASDARVAKSFDALDTNKDGQITQDEVKAAHDARRAEMEAKFQERFKAADKNGDGLLSKEEAQAGMPHLVRAFDKLDTNKDGELSPEELKAGRGAMAGHRRGPGGWHHGPADGAPADGTSTTAPALR